MGAKALGLVASALLATTLVACGATEQSPAPEPESVESAETDVDAVDESEDASDGTEASQPTPTTVEVNQSVTDEELGTPSPSSRPSSTSPLTTPTSGPTATARALPSRWS